MHRTSCKIRYGRSVSWPTNSHVVLQVAPGSWRGLTIRGTQLAGDLLAMTRQFKQQQLELRGQAQEDTQVSVTNVTRCIAPSHGYGSPACGVRLRALACHSHEWVCSGSVSHG